MNATPGLDVIRTRIRKKDGRRMVSHASIAAPELRDILKKVMTREIARRRLREER